MEVDIKQDNCLKCLALTTISTQLRQEWKILQQGEASREFVGSTKLLLRSEHCDCTGNCHVAIKK
jgi:hypothetical protein